MKLEINKNKILRNAQSIWTLGNRFLNDLWIKNKLHGKLENIFPDNKTYQNWWDAANTVYTKKSVVLIPIVEKKLNLVI